MNNLILLTVVLFLSLASAYQGPDLPPGPYCGKDFGQNGRCCEDRQDGCAHPIKETLCYCDVFCKRNRPFDDCCPDYETVCEGAPEPIKETFHCTYHDKLYLPGDPADIGCNKCTCTVGPNNSTSWACSQDTCMVHDNITHEINRRQADWEAFTYPEFLDKKLRDGVIYKLGTIELEAIMGANAISPPNADMMEDRSSFDARVEWPRYITPVRDQGWCGSDWAVSSAAIASDRFAILSKGAEHMELSPQLFLSCMKGKPPCRGGRIDSAWNFARNFGMVDEQCFPYHAERTRCPFKKRGTLRQDGCRPSVKERTDRYRMSPLVRLNGERAMMADIMLSGPLQAVMTVYQDFFHYRRGIYRHLPVGDQRIFGRHAVRVVGWGEERGEKYWIVANSWGRQWGEEGYFRILRGSNESEIEHFVVSALPEVSEAYQRK